MRAGALRGLLTIQRQVTVGSKSTEFFEPNRVWQDWKADIPCAVEVKRGREHFDAQSKQRYTEEVWLFRVRYEEVTGIDSSMRVVFEGQAFDIRPLRPDAQFRRDVILECTLQNQVFGAAPLAVAINEIIPAGTEGVAYGGFAVTAERGTAPYSFAVASGTLPAGLSLNPATGAISGTPTAAGVFPVAIEVTDAAAETAALPEFSITIAAAA